MNIERGAIVRLIANLQGSFSVEFELDESEALRSYDEINHALCKKGVALHRATVSPS